MLRLVLAMLIIRSADAVQLPFHAHSLSIRLWHHYALFGTHRMKNRTPPLVLRGGEDIAAGNSTFEREDNSSESALLAKEGFLGRTPIQEILKAGHAAVGANVTVCGWARTIRIQGAGTFAFIELNDGSTFQSLQAIRASCFMHPAHAFEISSSTSFHAPQIPPPESSRLPRLPRRSPLSLAGSGG